MRKVTSGPDLTISSAALGNKHDNITRLISNVNPGKFSFQVSPRFFWHMCGDSNYLCHCYRKYKENSVENMNANVRVERVKTINPLTPKISSVILSTVCQMILIMLVWRIWYRIN